MTVLESPQINEQTNSRYSALRIYFTERKAQFITRVLSEAKLRVIETSPRFIPEDLFLHAKARRISLNPNRLAKFEHIEVLDSHHYYTRIREWAEQEFDLLKKQNGCPPDTPTLIADFNANHNGEHLRVFYCLKHPDKIRFET